MTYNSYADINVLDEVSFVAGSTFTMDFTINENGVPVEIDSMDFTWKMSPYGRKDYVALTKLNAVITAPDVYTRRVTLLPADTLALKGKYVHQIIVVASGDTYRPAQGTITITSAIQ